jgi:hypothetical protein
MKPLVDVHVVYSAPNLTYTYTAVPSARAAAPDLNASETITGTQGDISSILSDVTARAVAKWGPVLLRFFATADIMAQISSAGRIDPRTL